MRIATSLSHSEKCDWLRLSRTHGVGPVTFHNLLYKYGSARSALDDLPRLARRGGRVKPLTTPTQDQAEAELDAVFQTGGQMLASCEPEFPQLLRQINPPPPMISLLGDPAYLQQPICAIVGSRNASAIGMRFARTLAAELGEAGFVIASGLARGIDGAAHSGALETGTIAVVAGGVDHVYPPQHAQLREQILSNGAIISERKMGHRATARDFPRRNRIISGLSGGIVVIEAAQRSGSLITARFALEQNREVFAAPGSPLDPRASGSNGLIRQGAHLIENAQDVLNVLQSINSHQIAEPATSYQPPPTSTHDDQEIDNARKQLLGLLSPSPIQRDELIRASGLPTSLCNAALIELELGGQVDSQPGGQVSLGSAHLL